MGHDWVITSGNGRVRVYGKRTLIGSTPRDRLNWIDNEGRQRHTMLAVSHRDPDRARKRAKQIAEDYSRGKTDASVSRRDLVSLFGAKDALSGLDVTPEEACRSYRRMHDMLSPLGSSPMDAAEDYAQRNAIDSVSVAVATAKIAEEFKGLGRSERYVRDIRNAGKRFAEEFGSRKVVDITTAEVEKYIIGLGGNSKTYNNHRATLHTIFQWSIKKGFAKINPVSPVSRRAEKRRVECYTEKQIRRILSKCEPDLIPWVVLQAFGCLRAAEVCRIEWGEHIKMKSAVIRATETITKTSQTRIIEMPANLISWLAPHAKKSGPVYEGATDNAIGARMRKRMVSVMESAKVYPVPNGLRKSCASHLVPVCDHIGLAAEMMGHTVFEMKRSYRQLVSKADAKKYWSIMPPK